MPLPKDTVEHIENQAIALSDNFNKVVTDFPTRTLPKDMVIESLESEMKHRNQFRAKVSTHFIDDFAKYFKLYEGLNCYINADEMRAKTIFDIGTLDKPLHCKHEAKIKLKKTALFNVLINANGVKLSQRDMAEWIEEWNDCTEAYANIDDQDVIAAGKAAAAIRNLTIEEVKKSDHSEGNFNSSKSQLEQIDAKSSEGLPGYFTFTCIPYLGLEERKFTLRLNVIKSHDKPMFVLRVLRFDGIEEELAIEFRDLLVSALPEECETFIGDIDTSRKAF